MITCPNCHAELKPGSIHCPHCAYSVSVAPTVELPSERIGQIPVKSDDSPSNTKFGEGLVVANRYRIIELLGTGAYGKVYKAFDFKLEKSVALKFMHRYHARSPEMVKLFYAEVRTAQELAHPNICRIHDIHDDESQPFISMEYVQGQSLDKELKEKGPLSGSEALEIMAQLCRGLDALHTSGFLHRDLKPANILIDPQRQIRITDFGLMVSIDKIFRDAFGGTIPYMAPEVLDMGQPSRRSDLYSLGVVAYEISTGRLPFKAPSREELIQQIEMGPIPPSELVESYDSDFEKLVLDCLQTEPHHRPSAASELASMASRIARKGRRRINPFIFGPAIKGEHFFGRHNELEAILNRLATGQSTFIVGESRSGKSSLLLEAADRILKEIENQTVRWMDLQYIPDSYTPSTFWKESLEPLRQQPLESLTTQLLERVAESGYRKQHLLQLFRQLGLHNRRLVLLLDEFDKLLDHPEFPPEFFAYLRSLTTTTDGLTIVPASRYSMKQLNERSPRSEEGSAYFNYVTELQLLPFSERTVETLLDLAGANFTHADRRLVKCLAGRQPALLQGMARTLFETQGSNRQQRAVQDFLRYARPYFDDLWQRWSDGCRTIAAVLGLAEWASRATDGKFLFPSLKKAGRFGPALKALARIGLTEPVNMKERTHAQHRLKCEGKDWVVAAEIFVLWVWEVMIAEARPLASFHDWQVEQGYDCWLTPKEWQKLAENARKSVLNAQTQDTSRMIRDLLNNLTGEDSK